MNKFRKILLTLAPISAIAVVTPIVLTSCSTNVANPQNPSNPGGGDGSTGENGNLKSDSTNSKDYKPNTQNGLFTKVEEAIKTGKPGQENTMIDSAFTKYDKLSDQDIKDTVNIWSNNKWSSATKNPNVASYISNLTDIATSFKEENKIKKWTINFTYKFQIAVKDNDKIENILAEKKYSVVDADLATNNGVVTFTTQPTLFMVNGQSMLDNKGYKTLFANEQPNESKVVKDVKAFLNDGTSKFDAKANFKEFIANHSIKGEQTIATPVWDSKKVKEDSALTFDPNNPTEVVMNLTSTANSKWGSCTITTSYSLVKDTFGKPVYKNKIKALVATSDYDINEDLVFSEEIKGDKSSEMNITVNFTKKANIQGEDKNPTLIFKVKGFAKTIADK